MSRPEQSISTRVKHFAFRVGRQIARGLGRINPKLVKFGHAVFAAAAEDKALTASKWEPRARPAPAKSAPPPAPPRPLRPHTDARVKELASLTIDGIHFKLAVTKHDLGSFWADYTRHGQQEMVYEPYMLACLTRLLRGSDVPRFMDVGAYLGYFAFYAAALMKDRSDVYAIESNEGSVAAMRESIRANGFSRLHVVQAALSDRIEVANIGWLTVSAAEDPGTTTTTTTTVTLDKLCASNKWYPNIVKIDVHGAEGKVILGMRETLKSVDALLLELHRLPLLAKYSPGVTRTQVLDALEEAGLKLYYIAGQSSMVDGAVEPPNFKELVAGQGFGYCRLDRASRRLLLFDRSHDEFILALRCGEADVKVLLGASVTQVNE